MLPSLLSLIIVEGNFLLWHELIRGHIFVDSKIDKFLLALKRIKMNFYVIF